VQAGRAPAKASRDPGLRRCQPLSEEYFNYSRNQLTGLKRSKKVSKINGDELLVWCADQVIIFALTVPNEPKRDQGIQGDNNAQWQVAGSVGFGINSLLQQVVRVNFSSDKCKKGVLLCRS
jgi:hypothetical protein